VRLASTTGQVGGQTVSVEYRNSGTATWNKLPPVTTKFAALTTVKLRRTTAVSYRAYFAGATSPVALQADASNVLLCTPSPLKYGASGPVVTTLQKKLRNLHIRPASVDGTFGLNTLEAIYAFQKLTNQRRTGVVTAAVYGQVLQRRSITAPSWCTASTTGCIDISQQLLYLKSGAHRYVIPVSSGGEYNFFNPQSKRTERAHTPRGSFHVYYKVPGATTGPLGTYYWISFFNGGYGIHGSASVPPYPASHGCVRVPRTIEQWVYRSLPIGAHVIVHD